MYMYMQMLISVWKCYNVALLPFQTQCSYGDPDGLEFALDGRMYELEYQVVDGDMDPPEYALAGSDLTTQGKCSYMYTYMYLSRAVIKGHNPQDLLQLSMVDGPLMLLVSLPVVGTIHPQSLSWL